MAVQSKEARGNSLPAMSQPQSLFMTMLPLEIRFHIYRHCGVPQNRLVVCMDFPDSTLRLCAEAIGYPPTFLPRYCTLSSRRTLWDQNRATRTPNNWGVYFRTGHWLLSSQARLDWLEAFEAENADTNPRHAPESVFDVLGAWGAVSEIGSFNTRLLRGMRGHILYGWFPRPLPVLRGPVLHPRHDYRMESADLKRDTALPAALLRTCRMISDEVKTLIYGGNTFVTMLDWRTGLFNFKAALRPETRRKIRRLAFILPRCPAEPPSSASTCQWNPSFWYNRVTNGGFLDGTLENLTQLAIMPLSRVSAPAAGEKAPSPRARSPPHWTPLRERHRWRPVELYHRYVADLDQWNAEQAKEEEWRNKSLWKLKLETVLPYLTKGLNKEATVTAHINLDEETIQDIFGPEHSVRFEPLVMARYLYRYLW